MLIPLITYPYLIRVLGKETYGLVVFAQAVIGYLVIIVSFGFNLSATKDISIHRNNKEKLNEIVSSVFIIKGILFLFSVIILSFSLYFFHQTKNNEVLFFLTMWMCIYELIFPIWYFQGIEQMKYITYITLISRLTFIMLIFLFIHNSTDFLYVPIINGIGALFAGITSLYIVFGKHQIKFQIPDLNKVYKYFRESLTIFASRISSLKDNTPIFLIGIFLGNESVAYYDLANKVVRLLISVFDNITNAVFPIIVHGKDLNLNKKIIKFELVILILLYVLLSIFGHLIILILGGKDMLPSLPIFYISGLLLIRPFSSLIGTTILITNNLNKEFTLNLVYSTIFYFIITILLFPLKIVNLYTLSSTIVLAIFFELGHRIYIIKKYKLTNWLYNE